MDEPSLRSILRKLGITVLAKTSSGWLTAKCPFAFFTHTRGTDRHPAFGATINVEGNSGYKCLACGQHGRISSLVRALEHYRETEYPGLSLEADMADANGIIGSWDRPHTIIDMGEDTLTSIDEVMVSGAYPEAWGQERARAYLERRSIGEATSLTAELVYDPEDMRIMFPVRGRKGELYGYAGRSVLDEKDFPYRAYQKVKNYLGLPSRALVLGAHLHQRGKPNFVVEGLFGYAHLIEIGARDICNPLCILGSVMTPQKVNVLGLLGSSIFLMVDNDAAGDKCLYGEIDRHTNDHNNDGAISRLQRNGEIVYVPEWPSGREDIDLIRLSDVKHILDHCPVYTDPTQQNY